MTGADVRASLRLCHIHTANYSPPLWVRQDSEAPAGREFTEIELSSSKRSYTMMPI